MPLPAQAAMISTANVTATAIDFDFVVIMRGACASAAEPRLNRLFRTGSATVA
jgi:hypothetical protein